MKKKQQFCFLETIKKCSKLLKLTQFQRNISKGFLKNGGYVCGQGFKERILFTLFVF